MSNNSGFEQTSYADQVVIVTGAASGIGRSAAQLIASRGASIICVDLNQAGLDQTVSEIKKAGGVAESALLDISNQYTFKESNKFKKTSYDNEQKYLETQKVAKMFKNEYAELDKKYTDTLKKNTENAQYLFNICKLMQNEKKNHLILNISY